MSTKPVLSNSDALQGPTQINAVGDFAEQGWHYRTGTAAARAALPGGEIHNGMAWLDTDATQTLWVRLSGAWVPVYAPDAVGTISGASGYTLGSTTYLHKYAFGLVVLNFTVSIGTGLVDGATTATLPSGYRPATTLQLAGTGSVGGTAQGCLVQILSDGSVLCYSPGSGNRTLAFVTSFIAGL